MNLINTSQQKLQVLFILGVPPSTSSLGILAQVQVRDTGYALHFWEYQATRLEGREESVRVIEGSLFLGFQGFHVLLGLSQLLFQNLKIFFQRNPSNINNKYIESTAFFYYSLLE